tara:strand:+ start:59647 stop:60858 length:1212 start_codon:yes stop_codon:yes gene_type:complete
MQNIVPLLFTVALGACLATAESAEPEFRTDDGVDQKLPWFKLVSGQFPPEGSAHSIQGELIRMDHTERQLVIRVDRNDSQQRGVWDLPLPLDMLPYGSIYYNGAPAALCDIPLGTHLHTWCYLKDDSDERPPLAVFHDRISPEAAFRRCIRVEDDFSYHTRQQQIWKIDSVDLKTMKLTASLLQNGKTLGEPKSFDLLGRTRVFKEQGFGTLESLAKDQRVQFNLTWVGLFGPGRILEIYIDEASRELATDQQMARHQLHIRERGLPAWVDAVDDKKQIVTFTFFDGVDPALFDELTIINPEPLGWPAALFGKGGAKNDLAPKGTIAVAHESLMTYDPTNDRKGGNILKISKVPVAPGCSGVQIQLECGMLLEGFRPTKIVRFYPASWEFVTLPREESYFGRE